jgi:hypothetical protein
MNKAIGDLLIRIKSGMPVEQALDLMKTDIDHELFSDLVTAIRFNFRYRGDLPVLLEQMEWQMNKIEEEYVRRGLSNARDRRLTLIILILAPLFLLIRILGSQKIREMFLGTDTGVILLAASSLCYIAAVIGFILICSRISG